MSFIACKNFLNCFLSVLVFTAILIKSDNSVLLMTSFSSFWENNKISYMTIFSVVRQPRCCSFQVHFPWKSPMSSPTNVWCLKSIVYKKSKIIVFVTNGRFNHFWIVCDPQKTDKTNADLFVSPYRTGEYEHLFYGNRGLSLRGTMTCFVLETGQKNNWKWEHHLSEHGVFKASY